METGDNEPAQALDYGQKGERRSQGEGATNSPDAASDNKRNTKVHAGRQEKHIEGSNNYRKGSSKFYGTTEDAQRLIDKYSGTGSPAGANKERVNFGVVIGEYFDPETQKSVETTMGIIHYSKTGAHIVPARPID